MNILFTTSAMPMKSPFFTYEKRPPLGLGFLMSITRSKGHRVFFIDNFLEPSNFIEEDYLQNNKIDFVAIYANTICYRDTLRMFNAIENLRKKGLWKGKIIVGGPQTSVALDTIPEFIDYIVQGEGERAILEIINGEVREGVIKKERIKDLDPLPFQPWDIFSQLPYDYFCPWMDIKPVFTMNTSRGCPFSCSFCSVESIWGKKYTYFSANRIISEIEYLIKDFGAKGIYFREDNFTLNYERVVQFCTELMRKDIKIHWACETRVDTLTNEELVELMSAAGCRALYLGVESGSQRILDILNKNITVPQIKNVIRLCKKYNIRTYCSLITGVPGETYEDYLCTENLMRELKPHAYSYIVFVGIPNSKLYKYCIDNNRYEYIDDIGLVYLPGYDVKAEYFYKRDRKCFVDYKFKKRTDFDRKLLREKYEKNLKEIFKNSVDSIRKIVPSVIKKRIKKDD